MFDCGSYYIGGTKDLKRRMFAWKFNMGHNIRMNSKMVQAFLNTEYIRFSIVEYVTNELDVTNREDWHIRNNFHDPFCLNIHDNAFKRQKGLRVSFHPTQDKESVRLPLPASLN